MVHGRHREDGRLWHSPAIGQLNEITGEHGRLDRDCRGLVVPPCAHDARAGLCDALWQEAAALLER